MIRYVLAVVLTVALLGAAVSTAEHAATDRSHHQTRASLGTIERVANSLVATEQPSPPGQPSARRIVGVDLPGGGLFADRVAAVAFERVPDTNRTRVTYRIEGHGERTLFLDAPLVGPAGGAFELRGRSGTHRLRLELRRDEQGRPVVAVSRLS